MTVVVLAQPIAVGGQDEVERLLIQRLAVPEDAVQVEDDGGESSPESGAVSWRAFPIKLVEATVTLSPSAALRINSAKGLLSARFFASLRMTGGDPIERWRPR